MTVRTTPDGDDVYATLGANLFSWLEGIKVETLFRTCVTCRNVTPGGRCGLAPDMPIPLHIVVNACNKYIDSDAPSTYK